MLSDTTHAITLFQCAHSLELNEQPQNCLILTSVLNPTNLKPMRTNLEEILSPAIFEVYRPIATRLLQQSKTMVIFPRIVSETVQPFERLGLDRT